MNNSSENELQTDLQSDQISLSGDVNPINGITHLAVCNF